MTSLKVKLNKARARLLGTATKDIAVPFSLACDCGNPIAGIRRASYQIATCSACDSGIYVLPVNVYPTTKRVRSEVLAGSMGSRLSVILRELAVGERESDSDVQRTKASAASASRTGSGVAETAEPETSGGDTTTTARGIRSRKSRKLTPQAAAPVAEPILIAAPVVRVPRPPLTVVLKRTFTPFRLLMLSAMVLITVTAWWMVTQRRMEEARKIWRREMDAAQKAFESEDLSALHDSLSRAVNAATTLNRDDDDSRRAFSLLQQTRAVQNLSSTDLISLLASCVTERGIPDPKKAATVAEALRGSWFALECSLKPSVEGLTVDLPLVVNSVPVTISISSDLLQGAVAAFPQSPLLFVASIDNCVVRGNELHLRLSGDTSTLITTPFHAELLGFTAANAPGLDALLDRQTKFLAADHSTRKDRQ